MQFLKLRIVLFAVFVSVSAQAESSFPNEIATLTIDAPLRRFPWVESKTIGSGKIGSEFVVIRHLREPGEWILVRAERDGFAWLQLDQVVLRQGQLAKQETEFAVSGDELPERPDYSRDPQTGMFVGHDYHREMSDRLRALEEKFNFPPESR